MRFALVALVVFIGSLARADLRVVGSDLLGVGFSRTLYEFSGRNGLVLALAFDGSRPGFDRLAAGRADVALLTLPADEQSGTEGMVSMTLAYHVLVVLAPAALPLEQLTLAELGSMFGDPGGGGPARWGDLGFTGESAGSKIELAAPAPAQGMMVDFFCHVVLRGGRLRPSVMRYAGASEFAGFAARGSRTLVLATSRAAGWPGLKPVAIAAQAGEPAFTPTPENLHAGDYPLRLPLTVTFRRERVANVSPLVRFLFSDEVVVALEEAGLVPLSPGARQQQRLAVERL